MSDQRTAYLQSTRDRTKKFKIVRFDKDTGTVTLARPDGAEFQLENFDKSLADKYGYTLVKE